MLKASITPWSESNEETYLANFLQLSVPFIKVIPQYFLIESSSLLPSPKTKTLLFSDSLNFEKANDLYLRFKNRINVAFGIGTYLSNDTCVKPLNIVMKVTRCNGQDVAKISDTSGKGMCKNPDYVDYLQRAITYRLAHNEWGN